MSYRFPAELTDGMATGDDAAQILDLQQLVFPEMAWTPEHLVWQHFDPPAGPSRLYVVRGGNRIVALYCAVRKHLSLFGTTLPAFMVQDVMTHPDFRGRGLLHHLANRCWDDLTREGSVAYTFPNKLSEGSFRRRGWSELMRVPLRTADPRGSSPGDAAAAAEFEEIVRFDERAEAVWLDSGLEIGVYRDAGYLNWRWGKPETKYDRFMIEGDRGFLVLKVFDRGGERLVHVCDLAIRDDAEDLLSPSLEFASWFAREREATLLTAWLPAGHRYAPAFDAHGLAFADSDRYAFATGPRTERPRLLESSSWHLCQADNDVF